MTTDIARRLKPSERVVYEYICQAITEKDRSPSLEEVRNACCMRSSSGVRNVVLRLERKGLITYEKGKKRSVRPVVPESGSTEIRAKREVDGRTVILPLETAGGIQDELALDAAVFKDADRAVSSDLFEKSNLSDGDIVLVSAADKDVADGDYLVVSEGGKYRIRRYRGFMLASVDDGYDDPIMVKDGLDSMKDADIQGRIRWILKAAL